MSDQGEDQQERENATADEWKRYELAKHVLDSPLDMTGHEDAKAGRVLASIAFLTAASATVFRTFVQNDVRFFCQLSDTMVLDLITIFFEAYLVLVTAGTVLLLLAFGPFFELPKIWGDGDSERSSGEYRPKSLFFFEKVADEDREKWMEYLRRRPVSEILEKACNDYTYEAHLVSTKVRKKVKRIRQARYFFLSAMVMLVLFTLLGCYQYGYIPQQIQQGS